MQPSHCKKRQCALSHSQPRFVPLGNSLAMAGFMEAIAGQKLSLAGYGGAFSAVRKQVVWPLRDKSWATPATEALPSQEVLACTTSWLSLFRRHEKTLPERGTVWAREIIVVASCRALNKGSYCGLAS
jgi:hypothetical protein